MIDRMPITRSLVDLLSRSTGKTVYGQGEMPPSARSPFIVVSSRESPTEFDESLADDYNALVLGFTITSVGERYDQAEALGDRVRRSLCQRNGSSWQVLFNDLPTTEIIKRESVLVFGMETEGEMPNVLFNFIEEFALYAVAK